MGAIFYAAFGGENRTTGLSPIEKPYNRPAGEAMHPPPLVAGATTFPPRKRGTIKFRYAVSCL